MAPTRAFKGVKAVTALALDGSPNSADALAELYILQEAASRWAFDSEEDLRGDEVRPKNMFDIIGGTGIGGFYAVLFTRLNLTIGQVIQAHRILEKRLFVSEAWVSKNQTASLNILQSTLNEIAKEVGIGTSLDSPMEEKSPSSNGFFCVVNTGASDNCRLLRNYRSRRAQSPPCTIRQALQATLSSHPHLPAIQMEEELFLSAMGLFTNPTRVLMNELQNIFPKGTNLACLVSVGTGHSGSYPLTQEMRSIDVPGLSQLIADEFASQCHELGPFFFRLSLSSPLPRSTNMLEASSQLKGMTMTYLDSHDVTKMLDDLAEALIERPGVVSLERLGSLAGKDGQSQLMARIHKVQQDLDDSLLRDINSWLQPIQQTSKLDANLRDRGETTCQWILENPTFTRWMKAEGGLFWYHGLMGTGKTMTMSFVTQKLLGDTNNYAAYYYFEFTNPKTLSEEALFRSVISQLAPAAPAVVRALHQKHSGGAHQPQLTSLQTALHDLVTVSSKPVFIIIDAVDELPPAQRKYLFQWLLTFRSSVSASQTHVMTTSREDRDIRAAFENVEYQLGVQDNLVRQDIAAYVDQQLAAKKWSFWPSGEVDMMRRILNERADGQFRMVACQIDILKDVKTSKKLLESLYSLPKTLASTYEYILNRIPEDLRGVARTLLAFLSVTDEPINVTEIAAFVAVDFEDSIDSDRLPVFQETNHFHDPLDLLDLGTSFVSERKYIYMEASYLQLAHASVKEYLLMESGAWFALQERPVHNLIASGCLALLHHAHIHKKLDVSPFVYSQRAWFHHVFPKGPSVLLRQQEVLYTTFPWSKSGLNYPGYKMDALLDSAASLCLLDFLETCLLTSTWDRDALGSALIAAAGSPRSKVLALRGCHILLYHGADVNYCGDDGNALYIASRAGNFEAIRLFVENGAKVNAAGGAYGTALQAAAKRGSLDTTRFLVENGADVNAAGGKYGTALQAAAKRGSLDIVQLLVATNADINATGGKFGTALQAAACGEHLEIVKYLLQEGAGINATGGKYGSALQAAAWDIEVARYLMENGANVNTIGGKYGMALQAVSWDLEVTQFLVERGADINMTGGKYGTALQAAAHYRSLGVVGYLVEKGANINARGGKYGTALQAAAKYESFEIIRYLVENGADVNATGGKYQTALQAAVNWGSLTVIQFLIEMGANVNTLGGKFGTALDCARTSRRASTAIQMYLVNSGAKTYEEQMGQQYIRLSGK